LDAVDVGVEVLDLEEHEAAREHGAAGARGRVARAAARETPAQAGAHERADVRAAVDVRLERHLLPIPRAAGPDTGIRHEAAARTLEDEVREDVRRHHRKLHRIRNLAALRRAAEPLILAKPDPGADLQ